MKKWIEEILRKVLGELLGAERLSALAKKVLALLLEDKEWVRELASKISAIAEEEKKRPETPEAAEVQETTETPNESAQ